MNTTDIDCILRRWARNNRRAGYDGCHPIDKFPRTWRTPQSFIVNSDPDGEPGTHWLCVHIDHRRVVFFDPLGHPPERYSRRLITYLHRRGRGKTLYANGAMPLQSDYSNLCGQYCVYALMHLSLGKSIRSLYSQFTADRARNDRWMKGRFARMIREYPRCSLENVPVQTSIAPIRFI